MEHLVHVIRSVTVQGAEQGHPRPNKNDGGHNRQELSNDGVGMLTRRVTQITIMFCWCSCHDKKSGGHGDLRDPNTK